MARRSDLRSRAEIQETSDKHKRDMDEKAEAMDKTADDAETVRDTGDALIQGGTAEGAEEVEAAVDRAGEVTVEIFDGQDRELEGVQEESDTNRSDLDDRGKSAETDITRIESAAADTHTRETADELSRAKELAEEDRDYLKDMEEQDQQALEESERLQKVYEDRVRATQGA